MMVKLSQLKGKWQVSNPVKIRRVEPILMRGTRQYTWVLARIQTDQGIEGIGECHSWSYKKMSGALKVRGFVEFIGSELQGNNPLEIETFLERFSPKGEGHEWRAAISAIEIAMWDILGQVADLPIYALLGGSVRRKILLYANHGVFGNAKTLQERVERAVGTKESGFRMFKWDPFEFSDRKIPDGVQVKKAIAEIQAFRDALGTNFNLAIDAHGRLSLQDALTVAKEIESLNILFFEAPVPTDQPELLKKIAESTPIPIADGESICTRKELKKVLDTGALGIIQPEVGTNGGILETFKMASMAEVYDVKVAPHNWCGPIVTRATSQVCATIPNLIYQEYACTAPEDRWENNLLEPPTHIEKGELILSNRPGLGSKLNQKLLDSRRLH